MIAAEPMVDMPELARDWWGLATWGVIGLLAAIGFAVWLRLEQRKTQTSLNGIATNTAAVAHSVNNRPDTTRDQLDRIERVINGMQRDIGRLADAAVDDRETHRTNIARLDRRIDHLEQRP